MKTQFLIALVLVFVSFGFQTHERTITGVVTSSNDGSPLPGVNIVLKGTKTGTATDAKGNYSIRVPEKGGTLVFSFIGMKTREIKIGTSNTINVALSADEIQLSEVVVSGYSGRGKVKRAPLSLSRRLGPDTPPVFLDDPPGQGRGHDVGRGHGAVGVLVVLVQDHAVETQFVGVGELVDILLIEAARLAVVPELVRYRHPSRVFFFVKIRGQVGIGHEMPAKKLHGFH